MGAYLEGIFWGEVIEHETLMWEEDSYRKIWAGEEKTHKEE